MTPEEALAVWAPEGSPWSPWTKPVLFSFLPADVTETFRSDGNSEHIVPLLGNAALVVELSGRSGVYAGLLLANRGYRPIPLYNASPACVFGRNSSSDHTPALIDVESIVKALGEATTRLAAIPLAPSAPPAFLLDAARHDISFSPDSAWFDNRSIVRTSDVPTGDLLRARGITQVVLIQTSRRVRDDLQLVLLSWRDAGLRMSWQRWGEHWEPEPLCIKAPSFLKMFWTRLRLRFQFSPSSSGAFGRFTSASGG